MENTPSAPRRALTAFLIVVGLFGYIAIASIIGSEIPQEFVVGQMVYYLLAGILWVFPAYWVIKKIYKSS